MAIFQMTVNICTSFSRSSGALGKLLMLLGVLTYRAFSPRKQDRLKEKKNSNKLRDSGVGGKEYIP